jgi:hypothetical protein
MALVTGMLRQNCAWKSKVFSFGKRLLGQEPVSSAMNRMKVLGMGGF